MKLLVKIQVDRPLILPINYLHILQAIIYRGIGDEGGMSTFLHDTGYRFEKRSYRMFTFSWLQGKYEIVNKQIIFRNQVFFEVRSPENLLILKMMKNFHDNGVCFGEKHYRNVEVLVSDEMVEENNIRIKMLTPICVYSTAEDGNTYFFKPEDEGFSEKLDYSFRRKYAAYTGIVPEEGISIRVINILPKDKIVTRYQGTMLSGYKGEYQIAGKRKYLDFLYQTGLGSKNTQGFGMFDIVEGEQICL